MATSGTRRRNRYDTQINQLKEYIHHYSESFTTKKDTIKIAELLEIEKKYQQNYPKGMPQIFKDNIDFYNALQKRYIELQTYILKDLIEKKDFNLPEHRDANLIKLKDFIQNFIKDFPGGEKNIIHCRDQEYYLVFRQHIVNAINTFYSSTKDNNRYADDNLDSDLIHLLDKLQIPLNLKPYSDTSFQENETLGNLIGNMIKLVNKNYNSKGSNEFNFKKATFLLSALTHLDIDTIDENVLKGFINGIVKKMMATNNIPDDSIVRILHSCILLSKEKDNFKTYIDSTLAKPLLERLNNNLSLNVDNEPDQKLAQQLYQIKNVYNDVFPKTLLNKIEEIIFNEKAKAKPKKPPNHAEKTVYDHLVNEATKLAKTYPGLIDQHIFDKSNPINKSLGLESDLTYENEYLKISLQFDGDKYHCYPKLTSEVNKNTQKTKLRDFCFLNWQQVKLTDSNINSEHIQKMLFEKVVMPTFDVKVANDLAVARSILNENSQIKNNISNFYEMIKLFDVQHHFKTSKMLLKLKEIQASALLCQEQAKDFVDNYSQYINISDKISKLDIDINEAISIEKESTTKITELKSSIEDIEKQLASDFIQIKELEDKSVEIDQKIIALDNEIKEYKNQVKERKGKPRDPKLMPMSELLELIAAKEQERGSYNGNYKNQLVKLRDKYKEQEAKLQKPRTQLEVLNQKLAYNKVAMEKAINEKNKLIKILKTTDFTKNSFKDNWNKLSTELDVIMRECEDLNARKNNTTRTFTPSNITTSAPLATPSNMAMSTTPLATTNYIAMSTPLPTPSNMITSTSSSTTPSNMTTTSTTLSATTPNYTAMPTQLAMPNYAMLRTPLAASGYYTPATPPPGYYRPATPPVTPGYYMPGYQSLAQSYSGYIPNNSSNSSNSSQVVQTTPYMQPKQ